MELLQRPQISFDVFLPHVMANVSGDSRAPLASNVALSYIRRAAIRFARETGIITRKEKIKPQSGVCDYPLRFNSENETVSSLVSATRNGHCVRANVVDGVLNIPDMGHVGASCDPQEIVVEFSVIPTGMACHVDSLIYDLYHDAIVDGALEQIHLMPQQPWTSGAASDRRGRDFREAIGKAKVRRLQDKDGNRPNRVSVNPRYSLR